MAVDSESQLVKLRESWELDTSELAEGRGKGKMGKEAEHTLPTCIFFPIKLGKNLALLWLENQILDREQSEGWDLEGLAPWPEHCISVDLLLT